MSFCFNQSILSTLSYARNLFKIINIINILLVVFIIYGLICKFALSLNSFLNSDLVGPGMVSLEIWRHHNYLLDSYYFPSAYSALFSDIIPFHLVPQIISDFNPMSLRIMAYTIFLLIILIFSVLIYKISNDKTPAFIFAAFVANLYPDSARWYLFPIDHNASIFFVGLFMLLFLNMEMEYKLNLKSIIYIILSNLIVFSDSITIAWFFIPFAFCYIFLYKKKTLESNSFLFLMISSIFLTFIYKSYFVNHFVTVAIHAKDLKTILTVNLPLYIKGLALLLTGKVYEIIPLNDVYLLALIALTYYIVIKYNYRYKYIYIYSIISALVIFIGYVFTNLSVDFGTTRYLMFTALSIYLLIALSYRRSNKIYLLLVFILLFSSAISNYMIVDKLDYQPDKDNVKLIDYLINNNLKYGYSDYWDSNIITYLSKEKVTVLPVTFTSNYKLEPFRWLSCEKWFTNRLNLNSSENCFVLSRERMIDFANNTHPKNILQFGIYTIYVFDGKALRLDL